MGHRREGLSARGIVLVVPPFQSLKTPSLALGLIAGQLERAGFACRILHLNLYFAAIIGPRLFQWISASTSRSLLGEFVFSNALFHHDDRRVQEYLDEVVAGTPAARGLAEFFPRERPAEAVTRLMRQATEFCAGPGVERILAHDPWLVGFTSSFQQNCSSLALIRALKARRPEVITVMGGANCDDEMGTELFEQFPDLDVVAQGECDLTFVEWVSRLASDGDAPPLPGILQRGAGAPPRPLPLSARDLDGLAHPRFGDYFRDLAATGLDERITPGLLMESSRGCWWGAKQHCTFCGLNRNGIVFRSKSPARVLEELRHLVAEYGIRRVEMVDNIMDVAFMKSLLPELTKQPVASLFYELKANLTRSQIRSIKAAGVTWIQAGLESLSDGSLRSMKKGTTALQNIQVLKWCTELGLRIDWNHLYGFPGEADESLAGVARDTASLHHLPPPSDLNRVRIDRFSPYFSRAAEYGLTPIRAARPYAHIYPFASDSLNRLAYFFDAPALGRESAGAGSRALDDGIQAWKRNHPSSHLVAIPRKKSLILVDTRPCARALVRRLRSFDRELYEYCARGRTLDQIVATFAPARTRQHIESALRRMTEERLILHASGRYLSLAIDLSTEYRNFAAVFPGGDVRPPTSRTRAKRRLSAVAGSLLRRPAELAELVSHVVRHKRAAALRRSLILFAAAIGRARAPRAWDRPEDGYGFTAAREEGMDEVQASPAREAELCR